MALKQTLECRDGLSHSDLGNKQTGSREQQMQNKKQGQGWLYKMASVQPHIFNAAKIYPFLTR